MKKTIILVAVISATVASIITVFAQNIGTIFPDVDQNAFYADSVYRMNNLGVIQGYENGNFGPNDPVTRGQLATILTRYDEKLLNPPWPYQSGVSDLVQVVCLGGIEFNIETQGIQDIYDKVCDIP